MTPMIRILLFAIAMSFATALAQDQSNREFLRHLNEEEKRELRDRYALDIASLEYFAKPGRIDIYDFNTAVLEKKGDTFTFTPFGGSSLEILSHRM